MKPIEAAITSIEDIDAQVIACVVASVGDEPHIGRDAARLTTLAGVELAGVLDALHSTAALGDVIRVPLRLHDRTILALVVGVGDRDEAGVDALRRASAVAARNAIKDATLAIVVPGDIASDVDDEHRARAMAEGAGLGAYAYTEYRTKAHDAPSLERITLVPGEQVDADAVARGVEVGRIVADGVAVARDLVNTPPMAKRPPDLAARLTSLAETAGLSARVHDEQQLRDGGFGGMTGVGRGSSAPPRLVELHYPGRAGGQSAAGQHGSPGTDDPDDTPHVVLVGKGITFDSGGLSLKAPASMLTMKSDLGGAAAIVGAMLAAAALGVRPRVTGLLALAENMPGADATRVSDVLSHRNGTTVEVLNTDAEGRLVLADALSYGQELDPSVMIDLATLTSGQIVALGGRVAALMGTDDELVQAVLDAGLAAGEPLWRLPLHDEYREHLRSEIADLKNIGRPRDAQCIVAALFLKEFTGEIPWAHLDIAGPAFDDKGDGGIVAKGGTGFGVRTLVAYLEQLG